MDNEGSQRLREGAQALGVSLTDAEVGTLLRLGEELLRWNAKVNLTSETGDVVERHFIDSLAIVPELGEAKSVLDLGTGAGFPGLPLAIVRPELELTLVDTVGKKISFVKHAIATLGLKNARAAQARAEGNREKEQLPAADLVVSRALMDVERWIPLAASYRSERGRVIAMLGKAPTSAVLEGAGRSAGVRLQGVREYRLPFSGADRALAIYGSPH